MYVFRIYNDSLCDANLKTHEGGGYVFSNNRYKQFVSSERSAARGSTFGRLDSTLSVRVEYLNNRKSYKTFF